MVAARWAATERLRALARTSVVSSAAARNEAESREMDNDDIQKIFSLPASIDVQSDSKYKRRMQWVELARCFGLDSFRKCYK